MPARHFPPIRLSCAGFASVDGDARTRSASLFDLRRQLGGTDNMPYLPTGDSIRNVIGREKRSRRNNYRAQLHHRQHGLPQRRDIAQHEQHAIATSNPEDSGSS